MAKKETKTLDENEAPVENENATRLAEIETELGLIRQRRFDYALYLNIKGKTATTIRNYASISQKLFEAETSLQAEKTKLLKGGK